MHSESTLRTAFEEYVAGFPIPKSPPALYDPVRYVISQPGKRIRPVLLLMAYCLFRNDYVKAMPAAMALEYFHNFTLVHDDIMDAAVLRRGVKSVHAKFGSNTAILAGDLMLIRSFDLLLSACAETNVHQVIGFFGETAVQVCEGQQLDMDFELRDDVGVGEYLGMIEKKTASLLGCAMQIGGLLAGADPQQTELLYDAGIQLGKAFQIHDDILDAYGDEDLVGKRRGGDILQKKKGILYALAWESSPRAMKHTFAELYNKDSANPEVKIQQVLQVFDKFDVKLQAGELGTYCFREAMEKIDRLQITGEGMVVLRDYMHGLMKRVF